MEVNCINYTKQKIHFGYIDQCVDRKPFNVFRANAQTMFLNHAQVFQSALRDTKYLKLYPTSYLPDTTEM